MKKVRWIGIILAIVLLVLSVGSIFAKKTTINPVPTVSTDKGLKGFLEKEITCKVVGENQIKFDFFFHIFGKFEPKYKKYELKFIPKNFSLLQWFDEYYIVEVTIEKRMSIVIPLVAGWEGADLKGQKTVRVRVNVYYHKRFEDFEEAVKYIRTIIPAIENEKEISVGAEWLSLGSLRGTSLYRDRDDLYESSYYSQATFCGNLKVIFSESFE